jgi:hypothetical protein
MGLKLNGAYQLLVYVDDENILEDSTGNINKNTPHLMFPRDDR